jgi:flagellar hook-associated protein 2
MAKVSSSALGVKAGGIDVDAIVKALMDAERVPQTKLKDKQAEIQKRLEAAVLIKTDFDVLRTTASTVANQGMLKFNAAVSDPSVAAATIGKGASTGSVSFVVNQLASTHGLRTTNTVASSSSMITSASTIGISTTLTALGVSGVAVDSSMAAGKYATKVVQSSSGATLGSVALSASTVLASSATLQLTVNGVAKTATVAAGTYTPAALAAAVQSALDAQFPGGAKASIDSNGGLRLNTVREGSAATLAVTGGSLLTQIGMPAGSATGTDGIIKIGSSNVISGSLSDPGSTLVGSMIAETTNITDSNKTLELNINGTARTVTLATGSYTRAGLVTALQTAVNESLPVVSPPAATVALNAGNTIRFTVAPSGSSASIKVTGGTALSALAFTAGAAAATATVSSVEAGTTIGPAALGGATFTLSGGLRSGDGSLSVISTGDRTLSGVAAAITAADAGIAATAVKVSEGNWLLQLGAKSSGLQSRMLLDSSMFAMSGGLVETSTAQDAKITVGSGAGAYSMTSSSSSFTGVMPGVTITAKAVSATPVTVSVSRDDSLTADNVESLVLAANLVLGQIKVQTAYDPSTGTGAALTSESGIRTLAVRIRAMVSDLVASSGGYTSAAEVGLVTARDGTIEFDRTKFAAALASSQSGVAGLFSRGGSGSPGLNFAEATDGTSGGTYNVVITQAASRAAAAPMFVGGVATTTVVGVKVGSLTTNVSLTAGATPAMVAASLNAALNAAGVKVNAEVSGGGVKLSAVDYGSGGSFSVNTDVNGTGTWVDSTGKDVVGTIDGVVAAGVGRRLWIPDVSTTRVKGLKLDVDEGVVGNLSFTYSPGIAGRLVNLTNDINADKGTMKVITDGYNTRIKELTGQVDEFERKLTDASSGKEAKLRAQWGAVQANLASLQSQQDWIKNQVESMNASKS